MSEPAVTIDELPTEERLDLIQQLWDSLVRHELEPTEAQRAELRRRSAELDADVAAGRDLGGPSTDVHRVLSRGMVPGAPSHRR